ncbi:NlpC/P60 family protein [Frankia sp. QA3]|uniref:NlpC/P60 family protein n=1 Tax=Frankia sp. QA3 TaxID=710111 RepID=UPI000269C00D|nr:NlpC/P60 family protein [Frankia sp. QA3]EIV92975.1 cell wall-associated hydrolase, invasion-associated protein [Frankia sp. QA3]
MATYTAAQIYAYARAAGFAPDQAVTMTAVALAESGGNGTAHATRGEDSRGLWQINMNAHRQWSHLDAYDPAVNARLAYEVSRGGRDISPWTTTHGESDARYLAYRAQAQHAAITAGDGDGLGNWSGTAGYGHPLAAGGDGAGGGAPVSESTRRFLEAAVAQAGDRYVYGAEANLHDADPGAFDCSELTQWAAAQAGVEIPDGAAAQYDALRSRGQEISVEQALHTPGALLFHQDASGYVGHVAISLGDGRTIEARNSRAGVGIFEGRENWLNRAAVLPGLSGPVGAGPVGTGPVGTGPVGTGPVGAGPVGAGGADAASLAYLGSQPGGGTDSDHDGLTDALEAVLGTDAHGTDSDHDGLSDSYEVLRLHANPLAADSDRDGLTDVMELASGSSPTNPDSAGTGRLDGATGEAATLDSDHDDLTDALERVLGTDPTAVDSDHDGVTDGAEHLAHLDPLDGHDLGSPVPGAEPATEAGPVAGLGGTHPGGAGLDGVTHA